MDVITMRPDNSYLKRGVIDLCNELKAHDVKNIIEIGSYIGESLSIFKEQLGNIDIITIDPFSNMPDKNDSLEGKNLTSAEVEFNKKTLWISNYAKFKFESDEAHKFLRLGFFDLVYIDGLHTYEQVKKDIVNYLPLIKSNGIIAGHDFEISTTNEHKEFYNWKGNIKLRKEVSRAVRETIGEPDRVFEDSSWIKFL